MEIIKCSLTDLPTSKPTVCIKNGLVFDKDLIKTQIQMNGGKCPMTGITLEFPQDFVDLVGIKGPSLDSREVISSSTSKLTHISSDYLNEIEKAKNIKKTIKDLKKRLTKKILEQKAALRLVTSLRKERDDARRLLNHTLHQICSTKASRDMEVQEEPNTTEEIKSLEELLTQIKLRALELNNLRKEFNKKKVEEKNYQNLYNLKKAKIKDLSYKPKSSSSKFLKFLVSETNPKYGLYIFLDMLVVLDLETGKEIFQENLEFSSDKVLINEYHSSDSELGIIVLNDKGDLLGYQIDLENKSLQKIISQNLSKKKFTHILSHPVRNLLLLIDKDLEFWVFDLSSFNFIKMQNKDHKDNLDPQKYEDILLAADIHPDGRLVSLVTSEYSLRLFDLNELEEVYNEDLISNVYLFFNVIG